MQKSHPSIPPVLIMDDYYDVIKTPYPMQAAGGKCPIINLDNEVMKDIKLVFQIPLKFLIPFICGITIGKGTGQYANINNILHNLALITDNSGEN